MIEYDTFLCLSKSPHVYMLRCCWDRQASEGAGWSKGGNLEVTQESVVVQMAEKEGAKNVCQTTEY